MNADELEPLVQALRRKLNAQVERIDDLERENASLRDRLADLESRMHPDAMPYERMDKRDKVDRVAMFAHRKANRADNGVYKMNYREVVAVFNGKLSDGGAYSIMESVAELYQGYGYEDPDGPRKLKCIADQVNEDRVVSALKKTNTETPA